MSKNLSAPYRHQGLVKGVGVDCGIVINLRQIADNIGHTVPLMPA